MGMFDSIYLTVKCPKCGDESERECQTKDLDCSLAVYRKGDSISTDYYDLRCITNCECRTHNLRTYFYLDVMLSGGVITGEYKIVS